MKSVLEQDISHIHSLSVDKCDSISQMQKESLWQTPEYSEQSTIPLLIGSKYKLECKFKQHMWVIRISGN